MHAELKQSLAPCRGALAAVALLSGLVNLLALTGSVFMLVVYDRVIPSGSIPTLVAVLLIALLFYAFQASVEIARARILARIALVFRETLSARVFDVAVRRAAAGEANAGSVVADIDKVGGFASSAGLVALFDLPWIPVYLAVCFAFHADIGVAVLCGAAVLVALTAVGEVATRRAADRLQDAVRVRHSLLSSAQRNAESVRAMGMFQALLPSWARVGHRIDDIQTALADRLAAIGTATRTVRAALQSLVLALGAYLVIRQEATGGIMIASSILTAKALAPVELAIAQWKGFVAARLAWKRLAEALRAAPPESPGLALPRPARVVSCERLEVGPPGAPDPTVCGIDFVLKAGDALAVIGPSGSGKSTLARALAGAWPAAAGSVRLDGMALDHWRGAARKGVVGYLPQLVGAFDGTVAANIARFDPEATTDAILAAARAAGVHEMIARLPNGYDTVLGRLELSGGQAQRIGLARALYGDPFLLVLDEPNAHLDGEGEEALRRALRAARDRGSAAIIVSHRQNILGEASHVLVMDEGRMRAFGTRDEILERVRQPLRPLTAMPKAAS